MTNATGRGRWPRPAIAAVAVGGAFVFALYMGSGVHVLAATRALAVTIVAGVVLTGLAVLLTGDRHRGGALALVVVTMLLLPPAPINLLVLGSIAVALLVERMLHGGRAPGRRWTLVSTVLDGTAVVLLVVVLAQALSAGLIDRVAADLAAPATTSTEERALADEPPDIYVLLLDGHLRPDRLHELFGAHMTPFVDALRSRGFDVASGSRANYIVTTESIPTMLDMEHLPAMLQRSGAAPTSPTSLDLWVRERINEARGISALRAAGYEIVALSPGFEQVTLRNADRFIDTGQINEFEFALLRSTTLEAITMFVMPQILADQHRARVVDVLAATVDIAASPRSGPRFVWVHVPSPHAPLVFAAGAEPAPPSNASFFDDTAIGNGLDPATFGQRYAEQAARIDGMALETIDGILAAYADPPVILLLSDHGSGAGLAWADLPSSDMDERTANLFASLTPGHPDLYGAAPTLINTLGILLNAYTNAEIDIQPDTLYVPIDDIGNVAPIAETRIRRP